MRAAGGEAFGASGVGGVEDALSGGMESCRLAVVDGCRGHQADPGVVVLVVVPVEELAAEHSGVLDLVEMVGELGPVLERLEVRFALWGCRSRCRAGCASL